MAEPIRLDPLMGLVVNEAMDAGVNPALALSLIHQESRFDPGAVSPTWVTGLAQVTNKTGAQYGQTPETRTDPVVSARAGMRYFRDLLDQSKGDVGQALMRYNGGSDPNFVSNVLSHYGQYAHLQGLQRVPEGQQVAQAPASDLEGLKREFLGQSGQTPAPSSTPDLESLKQEFLKQSRPQEQYPEGSVTSRIVPEGAEPPVAPSPPPRGGLVPEVRLGETMPSATTSSGVTLAPEESGRFTRDVVEAGKGLGTAAVQIGLSGLGGMVGGLPGAALGGLAANIATRATGLAPAETPLAEPFGIPVRLSDVLAVGIPAATALPRLPSALMRRSQAATAVSEAEKQTSAATVQWQNAVDQMRKAQAAGDQTRYGAAVADARTAQREYRAGVEAQAQAAAEAEKATVASQKVYQKEVADYNTGWQAQSAHDRAVTGQAQAAERLQEVPGRYQPQMPPRDMMDVRLDLQRLEQGGEAADAVVKRLGVSSIADATSKLGDEAGVLAQGGATMPPRPRPPASGVSSVQEAGQAIDPNAVELQKMVRQLGGIRVTSEELHGEFGSLVSNKETGTSGLLNNRTGKTAQQMAELLEQRGYLSSPDKDELLHALRGSIQEGKPVYPASAYGEAPIGTEQVAGPQVSKGVGGRVSRQLYQKFTDMFGGADVDISPVQETMAGMQGKLDYTVPQFQKLVADIQKEGASSTGKNVHDTMKLLGPYTRHANQPTREAANQLFEAYHNSLEASLPDAIGPLGQAKGAWRQEQGVNELQRMLAQRGRGALMRTDPRTGQTVVNIDAVVNTLANPKVMRWLDPQSQAALQADAQSFVGTPAMPRGERPILPPMPTPPQPVQPRPVYAPPAPEMLPGGAPQAVPQPLYGGPPPPEVQPTLTRPPLISSSGSLLRDLAHIVGVGTGFWMNPNLGATLAGAEILGPQLGYYISRGLLSESMRPMLLRALKASGGVVDSHVQSLLKGMAIGGVTATGGAMRREEKDSAGAPVSR